MILSVLNLVSFFSALSSVSVASAVLAFADAEAAKVVISVEVSSSFASSG